MKKFDVKSMIIGFVIGLLGIFIAFTTVGIKTVALSEEKSTVVDKEDIKSVDITNYKVYFNGNDIKLKKPLVNVRKDDTSEPQLYMPIDELLEYMHFKVKCDDKDKVIYLTMNDESKQNNVEDTPSVSKNTADIEAIEIIQSTGNWGYIEKYIPHMSSEGIEKIVDIYNSKHMNPCEHKKACDYLK